MAEFDRLLARLAQVQPLRRTGTVTAISAGTVTVAGLPGAAVGDRIRLSSALEGEVMALHPGAAVVMPDSMPDGLGTGAVVDLIGPARIAPDASWIGRVVDPFGNPLDGRALLPGPLPRALRAAPMSGMRSSDAAAVAIRSTRSPSRWMTAPRNRLHRMRHRP